VNAQSLPPNQAIGQAQTQKTMVEFQLLSVPIGLILGLGKTRIMTGVITAIRNREHVKLHWLPFIWSASFMI